MNVLYSMIYAPERGGSGAPIYTHHLLQAFSRNGNHAGIVFSAAGHYRQCAPSAYRTYPVRFERPPVFDNQPKTPDAIPFRDMTSSQVDEYLGAMHRALREAVTGHGYDLLHVQHGMYIGYAAALLKRELGVPYVITLHVMELNFLHEFPDPIMAKVAMSEADRIVALTEAQKRRLLTEYSKDAIVAHEARARGCSLDEARARYDRMTEGREIDPAKVEVCGLGIDTDHYTIGAGEPPADVTALGIPEGARIVLFSGRLLEMKGIRHLLEAEPLYNRDGNVFTIVIGGGQLEGLVREVSAARRSVAYLGFKEQSEVPSYLNYAASRGGVLCVPSSSEGLSLSYLEAMSCGLRVVACCTRDMGECDFMQPPYARFCDFGDRSALAGTIGAMLCSPPIARDAVRANAAAYSVPNMVARVERLYRSVLPVVESISAKVDHLPEYNVVERTAQ